MFYKVISPENETENISWFYDEYWSFHNSMNRNVSNRLFHLLNTGFEKDFFQLVVLPIVETKSQLDTINLAKKASNLSVLNFNEKVSLFMALGEPWFILL